MIDLEPAHLTIMNTPVVPRTGARRKHLILALAAALIAFVGIGLRLWLPVGFHGLGFDEALYRIYVLDLDVTGVSDYDTISQKYLMDQRRSDSICKLPPTRFLYIYTGWIWKHVEFGNAPALDMKDPASVEHDPATVALRNVSRFFSILLFLLSGVAAWRMFGRETGLVVLALMAFAPLQLHMSGHALIDGFFAFWATLVIWTLWEHLQQPAKIGWLAAYGVSLTMLVVTKENAFFVAIGIAGLLVLNRWMRFGDARPKLLYVTLLGPALGVVILIKLAGGMPSLFEIYHLLVVKAEHLDYAVLTGDGPWHRYLIDEVIVSPFVVCLAIGGIFTLARKERPMLFLTGFIVFTYAIMCQVRHGMNLRYATIWDFPLRALAAGQIIDLYRMWGRSQRLAVCATVAVICAYELWQYWRFFVSGELYEIPTASLLQAVDVLKAP